ncbi:hypothetical protein SH1V18_22170 [Vallitalea longa]|uniref:Solute-binding protein family 5 domain-containing protein n=1 Tax=Vallitalea longa TaxID=2936439 RepID=A0A9W5Y9G7_9FIRM|nr:ABC transporter substrate-binding protein [Vallitalea longa]GKX29737.1 hypothetical protein SH1V18_22170 [Vallitalea longa]
MKSKFKFVSLFLILVMVLGMFSGCSNKSEETDRSGVDTLDNSSQQAEVLPQTHGGTFKLDGEPLKDDEKVLTTLINADPPPAFNGNPFDVAGLNWSIQPLMFDYLCFFSPYEEQKFTTSLLENYSFEDKVLTMKLKDNLKWSDGSPLTADDILTNFYMYVGRSTVWKYAEKIEKVDDLTVKIEYVSESPLVLNITFVQPIMTPAKVYKEWADQYKEIAETGRVLNEKTNTYAYTEEANKKLGEINNSVLEFKPDPEDVICSGPYVIDGGTTSEILFKANEHFRKDLLVKKVRGLRPGEMTAFATALLEEQYTMENGGLSPDMSAQIDKKFADSMRKVFVPELAQIGYSFNVNKYPLDIPEVRKAICTAVDHKTLVSIAEPGSFLGDTKNTGLLPSLHDSYTKEGFTDTLTDYSYNPQKAEEYLTSIGWEKVNGKWANEKGEVVKITLATINSWPSFMLTGEAMATMLTEFGFDIDFKPMEFGVWNDHTKGDDKMISCMFLAGAATYAHPWESYNDYYITSVRTGWKPLEAGEDRIVTAPTSNKEYNVSEMLNELFNETNGDRINEITQELMTLTNDVCAYMSLIEKAAPLRVHDNNLSLAETSNDKMQKNYYYYGNINNMYAKMINDDEVYFVK